jgi:capsular exopolysaccharide synthesis family protein
VSKVNVSWNLDQLIRLIRIYWWLILLCTLLTAGAAVGLSLLQRKMYTASASLLFRNPGFDQMVFGTSLFTSPNQDPIREAATNIDLVSLPTIAELTSSALHGELSPGEVASELTVSPVGDSDVANIAVTDAKPSRATRVANMYAAQFILSRERADRAKIAGAQSQIQQQLSQLTPAARNGAVGQSLLSRANELRTLASLQTGNAELAQPAGVPGSPSSPNTKRNGAVGALLGLMLGFGLAVLLEGLDRRLREPAELEDAYGVPVLGMVPASRAYSATRLEPLPSAEAEAFALLRARLRYFNVDREVRSLLVTSAVSGEGKTTVALNLARAEAVAGSSKVVLVEADLRRPILARRLGVGSGPGLAEVLSQNVSLGQALQRVPVPGHSNGSGPTASIVVITAGAIPPNPAELIESRAMTDLLTTLSERFEHVIVDSPPTLLVSDAIPLMRQVSGVVIVSRIGRTKRDAARHLREQLAKLSAPTLGVVANGVAAKSRGYYGYGYGQAYEPDPAQPQAQPAHQSPGAVFDSEPESRVET